MKKIVVVVFVALMMISLMACSPAAEEAASVEGTSWVATSMETIDGQSYDQAGIAGLLGGEFAYEFMADGVLMTYVGENGTEGEWSQDGNEVTISNSGVSNVFVVDGSTMTSEDETGNITVMSMM